MEKIGYESLVDDENFKRLLKEAAQKDNVMRDTQDKFFDKYYWQPAVEFGKRNEFKLSLSMLVIYDSYNHSGSVPMFLRKRFKELTPVNGGDEKNGSLHMLMFVISGLNIMKDRFFGKQCTELKPLLMKSREETGTWKSSP